jgi:rhamnulokinase
VSPRTVHAAVDLGAGSGRVLVGAIDSRGVLLEEAHRFAYSPRRKSGHLRWDMAALVGGMCEGLRRANDCARRVNAELQSVGVDAWGVDYGLVDAHGQLLEDPICYRDERTAGIMERALEILSREALFEATGIQLLRLNTIFQLMAHVAEGLPPNADRLLLMPDLCHHTLCGSRTTEPTNASTTQLLNVRSGMWDEDVMSALGLPMGLMPPLLPAGTTLGPLHDDLRRQFELPTLAVIQPATHDTASAVAATPLERDWAFISSGTWSLVGVERRAPLRNPDVLTANITNERGVNGTFRFLKNVMGLWILDSCRREWAADGLPVEIPALLAAAAQLPETPAFIDPDDARFFNPPSMIAEVHAAARTDGRHISADPASITRIVLDSLALRYAAVLDLIERLTGDRIAGIHIVGGGSQNEYLNQATADAAGRPVLAGPVEATGLGNVLMQSVACKTTTVEAGRQLIRAAARPRQYEPRNPAAWAVAKARYLNSVPS